LKRARLVVIGHGMVGQRLLEELAALGAASRFETTVLCEEPRPAYDRVHLTSFFSGRSAADLELAPEGFFERHGIRLVLGERAAAIERERRLVLSASGAEYPYDKLVLATGSVPFVPPVPGTDRPDCFVYRTIEDLEAIRAAAGRARVGAVVGGGLLGLEAAKALTDLGLETHVVEFAPYPMAAQLDETGGRLLRRRIEALGVAVHVSKDTRAIGEGSERRHRLAFADGTALEADLVVFSAGIRPRDELARACGLAVGPRGGIVIDERCRTSDPDLYAIGECALRNGRTYGLVAPGYRMAEVAARHLAGDEAARFEGADTSTRLKLMGVEVASIGDARGSDGALECRFLNEVAGVYKKLVVSPDGGRLLGAILVGDASDYGTLLQMALNGAPLPARPETLILAREEGVAAGAAPATLAAGMLVCTCNGVSCGALCDAIAAGARSLGALKKATRAGTGCGGCAPLVKTILERELERSGVAVTNHLCEHFAYSRQELFHLVRVGGLRTFAEVLAKHGRGLGCDVCKPAIASILASCWNEFVLAPEHAPLQDTNDYFLANLQKDGSYSIVPRVPGGEIQPERLIALASIAKKYGLYTKITGAQRIDLFGARLEQLPAIWRELVEAGFESGHAYGKALRTVKSCVGSTWCRYGVQDSVAMAIRIETRYRGLRAPHKIKMAVSGCTRECAEAQGKDVGVIATERGWNLYVCGNGGTRPRHAELLARDLDDETLIRTIDRFLMFYIRTGDRLQRTAAWLEHLEGGIEYVRKVVCEDSLGIARELEADMQRLVEGYECEWKRAINDPATLRRFRHFVNSDAPDPGIVFVTERGQIRPARPEERDEIETEAA
jgi:nitrite reductase (NADH) large subunit